MIRVVLCVSVPLWLAAQDWPQFRGPNGSGVAADTGLPVDVGPERNVRWKTPLPPGHSSPILSGHHIFLTAYEGESLLTIALDRATGKVLWRRAAPRPRKEGMQRTNSPASPSPASDGRSVFVFFGDFGLLAYDLQGRERWRLPLGPFNNQNGHGSSPIVAGDLVVLICDQDTGSYLLALDKNTGRLRWRADRPEVTRGYATPGVWRPANGPEQLIVPGSYQLMSYNLKTGEKLWWVNGFSWQLKGVPVIAGDTIFVNAWETGGDFEAPPAMDPWEKMLEQFDADKDQRLSAQEALPRFKRGFYDYDLNKDGYLSQQEWGFFVRLRSAMSALTAVQPGAEGRGDLTDKVVWRYRKSLPNTPAPLLYGDALYIVKDGGIVTSLDPRTGEVLKQDRVQNATEQYWASPVAADGKVYLLSQACKLSVLRAQPQWETLAVNDLDDECFATPAVADGSLYVRTRQWLYCFRGRGD
jgi:outer membrane protein assembly factor BamB